LKVTFPDDIASYTREQTSYFGPDGFASSSRLRDVLGGATGGQYIEDYHEHGGSLCRIGVAFIRAAPTIENSQNPS
jgi:hypothetical protein